MQPSSKIVVTSTLSGLNNTSSVISTAISYQKIVGTALISGPQGPQGPAGSDASNLVTSVAGKQGVVTLVKGDVGLGNADNTSDASKPVSTATQTALNAKQNTVTLTTTGTSGAATFNSTSGALNIPNYASGGGSGTVTSASVVSANGLAGTIATATTTPAITLSTTVTGVLKGNGTAISAATAGTDYTTPTGTENLTNKTLNNTNTVTLLDTNLTIQDDADPTRQARFNASSISASTIRTLSLPNVSDTLVARSSTDVLTNKDLTSGTNTFPTFNQSTTGNAATVTTNANLTGDVTSVGNATTYNNVIPVTKGGTTLTGFSTGTFLTASSTTTLASVKTAPTGTVVGTTDAQTLTNKTINGASNTLSNTFTLTTTGTSGAATYNGTTLNIPSYTGGGGASGITRSVNNISTGTSAGSTALVDYVYICTGTFTLTLPTVVSNTNRYSVVNAGTGIITVAASGAETILGSATIPLTMQYQSRDFISDGASNWYIL